jgi:hypothetical protein
MPRRISCHTAPSSGVMLGASDERRTVFSRGGRVVVTMAIGSKRTNESNKIRRIKTLAGGACGNRRSDTKCSIQLFRNEFADSSLVSREHQTLDSR